MQVFPICLRNKIICFKNKQDLIFITRGSEFLPSQYVNTFWSMHSLFSTPLPLQTAFHFSQHVHHWKSESYTFPPLQVEPASAEKNVVWLLNGIAADGACTFLFL